MGCKGSRVRISPLRPILFRTQIMLVALDWGTSSLRAWLLDADGAVRDEAAAPLGILKVPGGDFDAVFRQIVEKWHPTAAIASGMIGSRQGWAEAPYANCPADAAALV